MWGFPGKKPLKHRPMATLTKSYEILYGCSVCPRTAWYVICLLHAICFCMLSAFACYLPLYAVCDPNLLASPLPINYCHHNLRLFLLEDEVLSKTSMRPVEGSSGRVDHPDICYFAVKRCGQQSTCIIEMAHQVTLQQCIMDTAL